MRDCHDCHKRPQSIGGAGTCPLFHPVGATAAGRLGLSKQEANARAWDRHTAAFESGCASWKPMKLRKMDIREEVFQNSKAQGGLF